MTNLSELKAWDIRWTFQEPSKGVNALVGKGDAPFPKTSDDLTDLRGLNISDPITFVTGKSIDLSGAKFQGFGQFGKCKFSESKFFSASLQTNIGDYFESCDCTSLKATGAHLIGEFRDCNFSRANLSSIMGRQIRFIRCLFYKTNFSRATLLHCLFEDCQFEECKFMSGSLSYSKFVRTDIMNQQLRNTLMEKVHLI